MKRKKVGDDFEEFIFNDYDLIERLNNISI